METDTIDALGIDDNGLLWVKPHSAKFPYIYREAMEVSWDQQRCRLYSPKPREWSYVEWFSQIRKAAQEQGVDLRLSSATEWTNIPNDLCAAFNSAAEGGLS